MLALLLYELRSRWNGFLILSSVFLLWDIILVFGFEKFNLLLHTLQYISLIGFFVILVMMNAILFHADFVNRDAFFISLTPAKTWKILLAKLVPIWIIYFILSLFHAIFMFFSFLSITVSTNITVSLTNFCFQLFKLNLFLFLLMTLSLLFLWAGILQVKLWYQNSKAALGLVFLVLVAGGLLLLYALQNLLMKGLSTQSFLNSTFASFPLFTFIALFLLSLLSYWIVWILLKKYTDQ